MSHPLRDDAAQRTRQAWIRTGLGAVAVTALAVRGALLGRASVVALVLALLGVSLLIGVGLRRARQAEQALDVRARQAWLVTTAVLLLGVSGVWLALAAG